MQECWWPVKKQQHEVVLEQINKMGCSAQLLRKLDLEKKKKMLHWKTVKIT